MLWFIAPASAHVPHDKVEFVSAAAGLSGRWCAVLEPWDWAVMACTEDGENWVHVGADALADDLIAGAGRDDGTLLMLAEDRLWRSDDGGAAWQGQSLDFTAKNLAVVGDTVW